MLGQQEPAVARYVHSLQNGMEPVYARKEKGVEKLSTVKW